MQSRLQSNELGMRLISLFCPSEASRTGPFIYSWLPDTHAHPCKTGSPARPLIVDGFVSFGQPLYTSIPPALHHPAHHDALDAHSRGPLIMAFLFLRLHKDWKGIGLVEEENVEEKHTKDRGLVILILICGVCLHGFL